MKIRSFVVVTTIGAMLLFAQDLMAEAAEIKVAHQEIEWMNLMGNVA